MAKFLRLVNGIGRSFEEAGAIAIYDEELAINSTITTGTSVALPNAQTYEDDELELYLNGQRLAPVTDYSFVGVIPRTEVAFTFDLINGDIVRFRIDRSP